MTRKSEVEAAKAEAIEELRAMFPPGSTAKTVLRHVSQSGMSRSISVISPDCEDITYLVLRALDGKFDDRWGGMKRSGCGMDMGFDLIYSLSRVLYNPGYACIGDRCPSNAHVNWRQGDAPVETLHTDGYAISQRWL